MQKLFVLFKIYRINNNYLVLTPEGLIFLLALEKSKKYDNYYRLNTLIIDNYQKLLFIKYREFIFEKFENLQIVKKETPLFTKKDISTRDIIEIPNIMFLVDDNQITINDKSILKNQRNNIINNIKNHIQSDELKTTDLANMDDQELTLILADNGVNRPLNVSQMLINNAKLWKVVLDRELSE